MTDNRCVITDTSSIVRWLLACTVIMALCMALPTTALSQDITLENSSFDEGGELASSTSYKFRSVVGTPVIGSGASNGFGILAGTEAIRNLIPKATIVGPNNGHLTDDETPTLNWDYTDRDGNPQRLFQVQVSRNNFQSVLFDSGLRESSASALTTPILPVGSGIGVIQWRVRVQDGFDLSGWTTANEGFRLGASFAEISVLGARTAAIGVEISEAIWQLDNDPYFWWEPPAGGVEVVGYSYGIDELPDEEIDSTTPSVAIPTDELLSGQHTFYVSAVNSAGNWGPPASFQIWTDTLPPEVVAFGPAEGGALNDDLPQVWVRVHDLHSGENPDKLLMKVNGGIVEALYDPAAHEFSYIPSIPLREGHQIVSVELADNIGNELTPFVWGFTVDTAGPTGSVGINRGGQVTNSIFVRLDLTAEDLVGAVTEMVISNDGIFDTEAWRPFAETLDPWKLEPMSGTRRVWVKFRDHVGNESTAVSDTILLDLIAPETFITTGPTGATESESATFTYTSSSSVAKYTFAFDDDDWSAWTTEQMVTRQALTPGNHYFQVRSAIDVNGNDIIDVEEIDPIPASRSWTVVSPGGAPSRPVDRPIRVWKVE